MQPRARLSKQLKAVGRYFTLPNSCEPMTGALRRFLGGS